MKRRWIWLAALLLLAAVLVLLPWRGPLVLGDGLFSWGGEVLEPARRAGLLDTLHRLEADDLYQEIPEGEEEQAVSFLCDMEKAGIRVLLLTGRPEWGLDPQAAALKEEVDRAAALAKRSGGALEGLMVDVEPYLTQSWEEDETRVMEGYVSAMVAARQYANRQGLALLACIPYWYDNDHSEALARLIEEGCDGVAVMNYYRSGEASHIQAEADLARAAKSRWCASSSSSPRACTASPKRAPITPTASQPPGNPGRRFAVRWTTTAWSWDTTATIQLEC